MLRFHVNQNGTDGLTNKPKTMWQHLYRGMIKLFSLLLFKCKIFIWRIISGYMRIKADCYYWLFESSYLLMCFVNTCAVSLISSCPVEFPSFVITGLTCFTCVDYHTCVCVLFLWFTFVFVSCSIFVALSSICCPACSPCSSLFVILFFAFS